MQLHLRGWKNHQHGGPHKIVAKRLKDGFPEPINTSGWRCKARMKEMQVKAMTKYVAWKIKLKEVQFGINSKDKAFMGRETKFMTGSIGPTDKMNRKSTRRSRWHKMTFNESESSEDQPPAKIANPIIRDFVPNPSSHDGLAPPEPRRRFLQSKDPLNVSGDGPASSIASFHSAQPMLPDD
jgi:hypothetical protein